MRQRGFTLIEMLVVVAIISILAAMLAPNLQKALRQAKVLQCQNGMRQLGLMLTMYSSDYDATLPPFNVDIWWLYKKKGAYGSDKTFDKVQLDAFWGKLTPYGLTRETAQCPFRPNVNNWMKKYDSRSSYFYILLRGAYYDPLTWKPMRTSEKGVSSNEIVWDTATDANDGGDSASWTNNHRFNGNFTESQSTLHGDGHVKLKRWPGIAKRQGMGLP